MQKLQQQLQDIKEQVKKTLMPVKAFSHFKSASWIYAWVRMQSWRGRVEFDTILGSSRHATYTLLTLPPAWRFTSLHVVVLLRSSACDVAMKTRILLEFRSRYIPYQSWCWDLPEGGTWVSPQWGTHVTHIDKHGRGRHQEYTEPQSHQTWSILYGGRRTTLPRLKALLKMLAQLDWCWILSVPLTKLSCL